MWEESSLCTCLQPSLRPSEMRSVMLKSHDLQNFLVLLSCHLYFVMPNFTLHTICFVFWFKDLHYLRHVESRFTPKVGIEQFICTLVSVLICLLRASEWCTQGYPTFTSREEKQWQEQNWDLWQHYHPKSGKLVFFWKCTRRADYLYLPRLYKTSVQLSPSHWKVLAFL